MSDLKLSFACEKYDRVEPLIDGSAKPEGIDLTYSRIPVADTFYRQLFFNEFDVSEMSISFFLIAKSRIDFPYLAIPVFPHRRFFHTDLVCNVDSGIKSPEDLAGKKIAVPEYGMTGPLWIRGILSHEFGVTPDKLEWYLERPMEKSIGAALGFRAPENIKIHDIPSGENAASLISQGKIDAGFLLTEQMRSTMERASADSLNRSKVRRLFSDSKAEGKRYYKKTGFFPINHTIVVRKSLLHDHPWIARNLYNAFVKSKLICYQRNKTMAELPHSFVWVDDLRAEAREVFGDDPFPYGFKANSKILDAITTYSNEQGLSPRKIDPSELFFKDTLDL